ncbi:MAG: non-hydrolyzing UDP-N-acetylglucosamine 2-epimerase [Pseudobdellovibrio sp.]
MKKKTIVFVYGTRPEFIKLYPLIMEARKNPDLHAVVCSTGQHNEMLENLYRLFVMRPDIDFKLMKPDQNLSELHAETMNSVNSVIRELKPDWLVVQGDTTSAHAAAMAAFYQKVPVAHVEAGLRTNDIYSPFPEEMNRRAISLVAKVHLCPTKEAAINLRNENIDKNSFIEVTGNTSIDTLRIISEKIENSAILKRIFTDEFSFLNNEKFILATMHRRESFGRAQENVLKAFLAIVKKNPINILFPVHPNPNVKESIERVFSAELNKSVFKLKENSGPVAPGKQGKIFLTEPLGYPSLVYAMKRCHFLMTDSGGLQEEAPTFGKKILVLRNTTERPEGVAVGFSKLVGSDYRQIVTESENLSESLSHWTGDVPLNPFGDGHSSKRIMNLLMQTQTKPILQQDQLTH